MRIFFCPFFRADYSLTCLFPCRCWLSHWLSTMPDYADVRDREEDKPEKPDLCSTNRCARLKRMSKKPQNNPPQEKQGKEPRQKTPTFLLELPLQVNQGQAARIQG